MALRRRRAKKRLPASISRHWSRHGILKEFDVQIGHSRLKLKVLIFDSSNELKVWWKKAIDSDLGRDCIGATNGLGWTREKQKNGKWIKWMEVDPVYYCIMGLVKGHLTMEIICHEACHAGFCYARRIKGDKWPDVKEWPEEMICYPAGMIAKAINNYLHQHEMYS